LKTSYFIKHLGGTLFFFIIMFACAGKLNYWPGLIYVIIGLIMSTISYTILKPDRELMDERSTPGEGAKKWDKGLLGLSFLSTVAMYAVAGFDSGRFHLSPEFHWSIYLVGSILIISGQLLFLVAQKQNKFFSSTVRIQNERGHAVCETGLYKIVRHPAYLGMIVQSIGFPLLLGSLWSLIPVCLSIVFTIIRTYKEDDTLKKELEGYPEYSNKTRYRIIPYVW
jgi:protein-S-isoprenylcysteine O-methyltransferase Ste14